MKKIIITILLLTSIRFSFSQSEKIKPLSIIDLGIEFQLYPTGYIPGLKVETNLSKKDALNFRLGMNVFNHQDFPQKAGINEHFSEKGYGFGFSFGYRHYFWKNIKNLFVGVRADLWLNKVNWKKYHPTKPIPRPIIEGTTNVVVVQPTLELGWLFEIGKKKNFVITPTLAFGYEWNAIIDNEQTGNGFIFLGGIIMAYRFNKN